MWNTEEEKRAFTEQIVRNSEQTLNDLAGLNNRQKQLSSEVDEKIKNSKSQLRMIADLTIAPTADYRLFDKRYIRIEFDRPLFGKYGDSNEDSELILVQPRQLKNQIQKAVKAVKRVTRVEASYNYIKIEFKIPAKEKPRKFGQNILNESLKQISRVMVKEGYLTPIFTKSRRIK